MWDKCSSYCLIFYPKRTSDKIIVIIIYLIVIVLVYLYQHANIKSIGSLLFDSPRNPALPASQETPFTVSYNYTVHPEEVEFPLAFSLLIYTDANRAIRLLRAIYRPHNHYCIHIDRKSLPDFVTTIQSAIQSSEMTRNIYLVPDSDRIDVQWGETSIVQAELVCTRILLQRDRPWKYWINLTGQEFPLRTNWELVAALKALNGSNIVEAVYKRRNKGRYPPEGYLPFNLTWYKGSVHVAVRREFVDYMLNNPRAKEVLAALKKYEIDRANLIFIDETYFATLNHNPNEFPIPGAFTGVHEEHVATGLARAKIWGDSGIPCGSRHWRRSICMYGLADLPFLLRQPHLFANKFLSNVEPLAYDIMELWHAAKIRNETLFGRLAEYFNATYYRSHPYATQHL